MSNITELAKLAIDTYQGTNQAYSVAESNEALRNALIEMNGGSTVMNYKTMRDHPEMFTLIETILQRTVVEGFTGDEFWNNMVDFRNVALGDKNEFWIEDKMDIIVAEAAEGTQGIRRQRVHGGKKMSIETKLFVAKIYEEMNRILAGQADFGKMIDAVAVAFRRHMLQDVYDLWAGATAEDFGGEAYFPAAGAFVEKNFLNLIEHVEASTGKPATIVATKAAIRTNLKTAIDSQQSDSFKDEIYRMGYAGLYYGTPVVAMPQRHKVGTTQFLYPDNVLTVISGDSRPIKYVYEGNPMIINGDPLNHGDLTQDYMFADRAGGAIITAGGEGVGRYVIV